jgi:DNA repair protein RecO
MNDSDFIKAQAIVLRRTNYGEADRIVTYLTNEKGKITAIAKGVRKQKSKLVAAVQPFCTIDVVLLKGKSALHTVVSARIRHAYIIEGDIDLVQTAYRCIELVDRATEDLYEESYFELLDQCLQALMKKKVSLDMVIAWFNLRLLRISGHSLELSVDCSGKKLTQDAFYTYDSEHHLLMGSGQGMDATGIKLLRVLSDIDNVNKLANITNVGESLYGARRLVEYAVEVEFNRTITKRH